jgi:hypothetical protein
MAAMVGTASTAGTQLTATVNGRHNAQYLGVAVGAGVAHTDDSELHVGYAVRSVTPHASYTPRLMQSAMPTPSNACACNISTCNLYPNLYLNLSIAHCVCVSLCLCLSLKEYT